MTEQQLKKELSLGNAAGVYLLCGDEAALILSYKQKLVAQLAKKGAETISQDAKETDWQRLFEDAQTVGFFGGKRLFVISGLNMAELSEDSLSILCELLTQNDDANDFVLTTSGEFDLKSNAKAKTLVKTVDAIGRTVIFEKRTAEDIRAEAQDLCHQLGCELTAKNAFLLIERCGLDLGRVQNECKKLCLYAGRGNEITEAIIKSVSSVYPDGNIFAVSRHIIKRDLTAALYEVDRLLAMREPVPMILSNLSLAFSQLFCASCAKAAGVDDKTAAKELKEKFLWRMTNAYRDCAKYDTVTLLQCCKLICQAETNLKSRLVSERVLLEQLIVRLTATLGGERL